MAQEERPLASILMPCWNGGTYIRESIASALAQTYAPLELIIAADSSDDPETLSILATLDDPRIRVLHVPHGGPSAARNAAARAARGKYFLPLDTDDLIDPPYLARGIDILAHDPSVGVVCCNGVFFGDVTGPMTRLGRPMGEILANGCLHVSGIYRRADFERIGGYDEALTFMEDWSFWLSFLDLGLRFSILPEAYFHYRRKHDGMSVTQQHTDVDAICRAYDRVLRSHTTLYKNHIEAFADVLRHMVLEARQRELQQKIVADERWDWHDDAEDNRWMKLGRQMPWAALEARYASSFPELRDMAHPVQTAVGIVLIQAELHCSDEEIIEQLQENPFMRAFAGLPGGHLRFPDGFMAYLHAHVTDAMLGEIAALLHGGGSAPVKERG